jgi:uncharacterized protein (DUF927 family)
MTDPRDAQTTPFWLTLVTASKGYVTKKFTADPVTGAPVRDRSRKLSIPSGRVDVLAVPGLEGLQNLLARVSKKQCLVHGVPRNAQAGDSLTLVTQDKYTGASGTVARTLDSFYYPDGPRLVMFDYDPWDKAPARVESAAQLIDLLATVILPLADVGHLATISTSSAIRDKHSKEFLIPPSGMHIYFLLTGDVGRFRDILRTRLWNAGFGYVRLATPNAQTGVAAMLERSIIDLTVFSPERVDFVAGADIDRSAPFFQDRPAPVLHPGIVLDADALPDLTADEQVGYEQRVAAAKEAMRPEQTAIIREKVRATHPDAEDAFVAAEVHARATAAENGALAPDHLLHFENGKVLAVKDLKAQGKPLDRKRLADPLEPTYGPDQATFFWEKGNWVIVSHSHGVTKSYRLQIAPPRPPTPHKSTASEQHTTSPSPLKERFRIDADGVWFTPPPDKEGNTPPDLWVCGPLRIVAATRDEQSDNHGHLLEFSDRHGHPQQWAMPLSLLEDAREYRKVLRCLGLKMNGNAKQALQTYLDVTHAEQLALCVDRVGWHKEVYVLPGETIGNQGTERIVLQSLDQTAEGYRQGGDLEGWRREVSALCIGNSRLLVAVSAGFAAPLLSLLGEESGGMHFRGSSSEGKTTTLLVAATVWGEPGRLERWRTTANALEGVALAHNDNLLCLDELKEVEPREAGAVAYMLANGTGKRRGHPEGGTRPRLTWRLLFLSTGEMNLEQHIAEAGQRSYAGQEVRLVDLPADAGAGYGMFEDLHGAESSKEFVEGLRAAVHRHYGYAGRALVAALAKDLAGDTALVQALCHGFVQRFLPEGASGQAYRVAKRFALIGTAGEIATAAGITGWPEGAARDAAHRCFREWIRQRGGVGNMEEERALAQVRVFFERYGEARFKPWTMGDGQTCERCRGSGRVEYSHKNGECFDCHGTGTIGEDTEPNRPVYDRAGFRRATEDDRTEFYVLPEVFKQEITKGLDALWVARLLVQRGLMHTDEKAGKFQVTRRLPGMGGKRVYHMKPEILGEAKAEEPSV